MIIVENLSKKYRRGTHRSGSTTLRQGIHNLFRNGFRRNGRELSGNEFYALRDVGFKVAAGEVVGIIGRNGAGKSTLLKIMSRIVFPDTGSVTLFGRVGSLLEIGAGFNQELTGRENVFLSGAILGMSDKEIRRKYDEIVEFAGVEKFIDDPVKRYSSGMYLRLAFSVAAYLEPEILFLDEILGVGDFEFQKRCIAKIRELSLLEGRTVLLVSHSLETIENLCRRTLWFEAGQLKMDGRTPQVIAAFKESITESPAFFARGQSDHEIGNEIVRLQSVRVTDNDGQTIEVIDVSEDFWVEIEFDILSGNHIIMPRVEFCNESGACLFWSLEVNSEWQQRERPIGHYVSRVSLPANLFNAGKLNIGVGIYSLSPQFDINVNAPNLIGLQVFDQQEMSGSRGDFPSHIPGFIRPLLNWTSQKI